MRTTVPGLGVLAVTLAWGFSPAAAQAPGGETPEVKDRGSFFDHPDSGRFWISGQVNIIFQAHPPFRAPYTGPNSLIGEGEHATSRVLTLYTGVRIGEGREFLLDLESAGGHALSNAFGAAGFPNLDIVRNPALTNVPYVARAMLHQTIGLSDERGEGSRGPFSLAPKVPVRRLEARLGKFDMVDFFDVNPVLSDTHLQLMNWATDNNAAFDYAADTRGYTWGLVLEYQDRSWAARFAEALMPKVANGINLDFDPRRAGAENFEFELRTHWLPRRDGVVRVLAYHNRANMGSYRAAIDAFRAGQDPVPDVVAHRLQGRTKNGFGLNVDQEICDAIRVAGRFGWSDGRNESFAYTETDRTLELGAQLLGRPWGRGLDRTGIAFVVNSLSPDHRDYLALGGLGFLLGDGALHYGPETILEVYYTAHAWHGLYGSFDLQGMAHPGYNRDRGPVLVPSLRLHLEF